MKCTVVFLVLSMVVLMAEPGESFVGLIVKGAFHAGKWIHRLVRKHRGRGFEQEQLDKRSFDYNAGRSSEAVDVVMSLMSRKSSETNVQSITTQGGLVFTNGAPLKYVLNEKKSTLPRLPSIHTGVGPALLESPATKVSGHSSKRELVAGALDTTTSTAKLKLPAPARHGNNPGSQLHSKAITAVLG
eukprot:superscaffoldBa00002422_g14185